MMKKIYTTLIVLAATLTASAQGWQGYSQTMAA